MENLFDSPFTPTLLAGLAAGVAVSLMARLARAPLLANLAGPAVFLAAYYETYQKIPPFPPTGSTNKIFYVVLAATVAGILLDLARPAAGGTLLHRAVWGAAPLLIALWIVWPRLTNSDAVPDGALLLTLLALVCGGALLLWRLDTLPADPAGADSMTAWVLLAVLPAVFAPIALFGGSSTSVGLCLGLLAGLGAAAVVNLVWPRALGLTAILAAGGGLLAVIDTVTLITRRVDLLALAVFLLAPFAGQFALRLMPVGRTGPRLRAIAAGILAATPLIAVLVILFSRHENPLGN